MNINPNDPVVAMLKEIVDQYEVRLRDLGDAIEMMVSGTSHAIAQMKSRIAVIEAKLEQLIPTSRKDTEGKEL